ncbi:hypothetical protein B0H14DRAFT_2748904, partial [Mycena olivaceomarginata]
MGMGMGMGMSMGMRIRRQHSRGRRHGEHRGRRGRVDGGGCGGRVGVGIRISGYCRSGSPLTNTTRPRPVAPLARRLRPRAAQGQRCGLHRRYRRRRGEIQRRIRRGEARGRRRGARGRGRACGADVALAPARDKLLLARGAVAPVALWVLPPRVGEPEPEPEHGGGHVRLRAGGGGGGGCVHGVRGAAHVRTRPCGRACLRGGGKRTGCGCVGALCHLVDRNASVALSCPWSERL